MTLIVNDPGANCCETSYHGNDVRTTVKELTEKFGEPACDYNGGDDKVNYEWTGVIETGMFKGEVFTIYDWKEYRPIGENELIYFHIGANSSMIAMEAADALMGLLN